MVTVRRLKTKLTVENLWMYIIHLLHTEGPMSGVEIKKRIESKYRVKFGNVLHYKVLYALENLGLVKKIADKGGKVYQLTEEGLKHLVEAIQILENYTNLLKEGLPIGNKN